MSEAMVSVWTPSAIPPEANHVAAELFSQDSQAREVIFRRYPRRGSRALCGQMSTLPSKAICTCRQNRGEFDGRCASLWMWTAFFC